MNGQSHHTTNICMYVARSIGMTWEYMAPPRFSGLLYIVNHHRMIAWNIIIRSQVQAPAYNDIPPIISYFTSS